MKPIHQFINERMDYEFVLSIINTYLDNLDKMDYQHQQHFLNRLKLCNGFEDLSKRLISELDLVNKMNENILKLFNTIQFGNIDEGFKSHLLELYESDVDERKKKVYEYLLQNDTPQFKTVLLLGILLEQYSVYLKMKPDIDGNTWEELKQLILSNFYLIEDFTKKEQNILNIPVNVVNLLYYTRYVCEAMELNELIEPTNTLINNVTRTLLLENSKEPSIDFIYGLTHVLIGESAFYTRSIHKNPDLNIIGEQLAKYLAHGKDITNDILCEATFCLKLLDKFAYDLYINTTKEKCFKQLSKSKPILYNFKPGLQNNEHTNILFILLCLFD